jgi:cell division septal protein FtsQ
MTAVAAPADRRFRRVHVKPARKRRWWRGLVRPLVRYGLLPLALGYALYRTAAVVAQTRMLQVDRVVIAGNERLSEGEVLAVLEGLRGESVIWTDLDVWRRRLLASPWVREASLRRSLPSTVEVFVAERQPVGIGRLNGEMYLVDERGVVIDQYGPQYADLDLPIVDGLAAQGSATPATPDAARSDLVARIVAAVKAKPHIARRVSQIDVSDVHNAALILSGDPAVIYVGDDRFLPRLQSYIELASTLRARVPDIDYVDLRFDDRIYIRPQQGAARAASTRDAANAPAGKGGRRP